MINTRHVRAATGVVLVAILLLTSGDVAGQTTADSRNGAPPDREYILESSMIGYRGRGGEIDGVRNPTLWARTGERVRLTIINSELMVHDIALEKLKIKSPEILDKGASASVTFTASASNTYYCSSPGHRAAGMEGRLEVSDAPPTRSEGVAPEANGRPLNLDFETGTLDDWTATGDAFDIVKGDGLPDGGAEKASVVRGQSGADRASSGVRGSARRGTLTPRRSASRTRMPASWCPAADSPAPASRSPSPRTSRFINTIPAPTPHGCGPRWWIPGRTPARTSSSGWSTTKPERQPQPT